MRLTPFERVVQKSRESEAGCWVWTGWLTAGGYGRISVHGKGAMTHRIAYEEFIGPIPDGLCLDHLCRNRALPGPNRHGHRACPRCNCDQKLVKVTCPDCGSSVSKGGLRVHRSRAICAENQSAVKELAS